MEPIKTLKGLEGLVKEKETPRMVVAYGQDEDTIKAAYRAVKENVVNITLVGDQEVIHQSCKDLNLDAGTFEIVDEPNEKKSGDVSVKIIAEKKAQALMKGLISTPYFLRSILNKELNLLPPKCVISHSTLIEVPTYDKLLMLSDVAMIPNPDLNQKIAMINYNIAISKKLGIKTPKIALVSANEKVSPRMQSTVDAAIIAKMAQRKQIKGAIIDGPLAFDLCISPRSCEIKGFDSPIQGDADMIIFPEIVSANVCFKAATFLAGGELAGVLTGIPFPTVLVSRADSDDSKYYSIVYAAMMV